MKMRWGTCDIEAQRICLNLELIKKLVHCLEYIVVHEMVHLLERHHNERFQGYMSRYMLLWQYYRKELNREPLGHVEWGILRDARATAKEFPGRPRGSALPIILHLPQPVLVGSLLPEGADHIELVWREVTHR